MLVSVLVIALGPKDVIRHGPPSPRRVALTFDACQTSKPAGYDSRLIAILRSSRAKATLFLGGAWMEAHPNETASLGQDPLFEIGSHSYLHPHMTKIDKKSAEDEIDRTQAIQRRIIGRSGRLFRPPYGEYDARLLRLAESRGLKVVLWSLVSGDPDPHVSARRMTDTVLQRVKPGDIVIMHMNGRGKHTAEALPAIVAGLRKKGFELVTISELLAP